MLLTLLPLIRITEMLVAVRDEPHVPPFRSSEPLLVLLVVDVVLVLVLVDDVVLMVFFLHTFPSYTSGSDSIVRTI
jgi:hypothetical protein